MSKVLTVLELNEYVNSVLTRQPLLQNLQVSGELSNVKLHSSGHIYFTLKSESAAVKCVMFRSSAMRLTVFPEEGQQVTVTGYVQLYVRDGQYQLYARDIALAGEGELYRRFLALKGELEKLGYFNEDAKKPIPRFVKKIGVATSPTGAVIRDIINVATRRNPSVQILLYPVKVQGLGAAEEIAYAIDRLNTYDVDVIIVGRGGGSMEDLWAFNERAVADAIFRSAKPVISAVGHQTDFTIADFVADLRAPTPSAAAEQVTFEREQLLSALNETRKKLQELALGAVKDAEKHLFNIKSCYMFRNPERLLSDRIQRLDALSNRLVNVTDKRLTSMKSRLSLLRVSVSAMSPDSVLNRGYAIVTDDRGKAVKDLTALKTGDGISIKMKTGTRDATVK